jgi:hypothetical protein
VATSKNIGAEWSVAYAMSIKRLDSQFMLCLLRLMSWPNLGNMHGDLVDDLRLICALLAKRPMVGFLIARRLKLPVDKTFALLSVLQSKGHITALGAYEMDVDLNALESVNTPNGKAFSIANAATFATTESPSINTPRQHIVQPLKTVLDTLQHREQATVMSAKNLEPSKVKVELQNSGDVLNQLWRVLNTDIVMSKAARDQKDPKAPIAKEAGDVLSQLWNVLNTDIVVKLESSDKPAAKVPATGKAKATTLVNAEKTADKNKVTVLRDVNGQRIIPDELATKSVEDDAKDVMGQLWSVLNTDIAFKRQSGNDADADADIAPSAAKTKEVAEVMSQLWRVLNTEIAVKRQFATKDGSVSLSDTTKEANDKLSKLWRILDAEIILKKKPTTYLMTDEPVEVVKKDMKDTSGEAVDRLSQLWQVLNSEIAIALPPERRPALSSRR